MKLSKSAPALVSLAIGALALGNCLWSISSIRHTYDTSRKQAVDQVGAQLRAEIEATGRRAAMIAETVAAVPVIQAAFKASDREALHATVDPSFRALKDRFGVEVIQFNGLDTKVLLRMHDPKKFGDDLSGRELFMSTMQRKVMQSGVDVGSSGVKVRSMLYVTGKDVAGKDVDVGLLEVGLPFDPVVNAVNTITGFDLGVFVAAKLAGKSTGREVGKFKEIAATNADLMKTIVSGADMDFVQEATSAEGMVNGTLHGIVKVPLLDFAGQNIGTVVAARSFEVFQKAEKAAVLQAIIQAILMTVFGAGVISITFVGLVMAPLRSLRKILDKEEVESEDVKELEQRDDEIGEIARKSTKTAA